MSTGAPTLALILLAAAVLAWRLGAATRVYQDARARRFPALPRLGYAARALVAPDDYWWGARLERLTAAEQTAILAEAARRLGLRSVANLRCPLCRQEMGKALSISPAGQIVVPRETICPACGFRLDACRHCQHFKPGAQTGGAGPAWGGMALRWETDYTQGACQLHKEMRSVADVCPPQMANKLLEMGLDYVQTPKAIPDSFVPLEDCRAFTLDEEELRRSDIRGVDKRRARLLRLLISNQVTSTL
ncbi:MAG: hypothetical protein FJZ89_07955 [Chloroflexi bacterium]|nr:hypothetical protein [Chloroflexota bacterium]